MTTIMQCLWNDKIIDDKISASFEDSDISNFIILGDFNSAVDSPFQSELL